MQSLSGGRRHREMQAIERTGGAGDDIGRHAGIDRRRRQPAMAEVAVSRQMFAAMLTLIARLRAPPTSA
jgi:hypothetical protein